ncbi:MAG TPA: TAXI family TRAP transporter solute-binding subunit [Casimicrobiaceae bacterium]|nr:TAXI family TRAP transporter solute-binding subunit [Casimicrobiaceae bacterium]
MNESAVKPSERWQPRDREAQLLADLLRLSPLTVLYGARGAGKTTLLKRDLLPMLGRRRLDRNFSTRTDQVVVPFPDRRGNGSDRPEIAVYFDNWREPPLPALYARIASALKIWRLRLPDPPMPLRDALISWHRERTVRFLFILDCFEQSSPQAGKPRPDLVEFGDTLVQLIDDCQVPANFLLVLRDDAEGLIAGYRSRLPYFGDSSIRLPSLDRAADRSPLIGNESEVARLPVSALPLRAVDVRPPAPANEAPASIDVIPDPPTSATEAVTASLLPVPTPQETRVESIAIQSLLKATQQSPVPLASGGGGRRIVAGAAAVIGVGVLLAYATIERDRPNPPSAPIESKASVAPVASPIEPPVDDDRTRRAALPPLTLTVDRNNATQADVGRDLATIVADAAGINLVVAPGDGTLPAEAAAAIATYDIIRPAARAASSPSRRALIVAPLYVEEIVFVARKDSALTFVHEAHSARVAFGEIATGGRLTAERIWRRMFGNAAAAPVSPTLSIDDALRVLAKGDLDVVIVVDAQPSRTLTSLPAETKDALKLLRLDLEHDTARGAVDDYLIAWLKAATLPGLLASDTPTFATMAFLVTHAGAPEPERLRQFAVSLCHQLPLLRREGHRKWREVDLALRVEGAGAYWPPSANLFDDCTAGSSTGGASAQSVAQPKGDRQ